MVFGTDQLCTLVAIRASAKGLPVSFIACVPCQNYEAKWAR